MQIPMKSISGIRFGEASFFCERENCLRCVCMHSGGMYQDRIVAKQNSQKLSLK
jgi:hypothetical protein